MKKLFLLILLLGSYGAVWPFSWLFTQTNSQSFGSDDWINQQVAIIKSQGVSVDQKVLRLSLIAYTNAKKQGFSRNNLLTIIDYSKPSSEKRLWVLDLKNNRTLFHTWVTHGKNSGNLYANSFSNQNGSLKSSIGLFTTDYIPYIGGNGYSLRLNGLEHGINDRAYQRSVVIHGAWYASADTIKRYGQLGRSWGCPAVSTDVAKSLIDTIKSKTLVFAYYPDSNWLRRSRFLSV